MARFTLGRFRKAEDAVVQPGERKRGSFRTPALLISGFLLSSIAVVAQTGYTGVFGGGPIYKNSSQTLTDLQNTGFTEVTVWSMEVSSDGDLNFNGEFPLTSSGSYVGNNSYPNFPSTLASLKQGKVKRITFSVGSSNVGDWADIESLVESQGTGPGSILYKDFQALKQAIPSLDAIDFDQENNFDESSTIAFGVMLGNLGYHVVADVYDDSSFWSDVVSGINSQAPGTVDTVHLQTYSGGSGNNPCSSSWNFGSGIAVLPGLADADDSASQIQSTVAGWYSQCGILGAWDWLYDDFAGTGDAGSYAAAYNAGVKKGSGNGSYNIFGIYNDGTSFPNKGIDGDGYAFSSNLLGTSVSWNGDTFTLGPAGSANVWSNTTIPISAGSGSYGALDLLATGVNGSQTAQTFIITYTDGTTSTVTQNLSDWGSPQNYSGESTAVTMQYRDESNGDEGTGPFYLYGYSFPINSSKTVQSVALPMNRNVVVLGYALHAGTATSTPVNLSSDFNRTGAYTDGTAFSATGGLDGNGYAYSSNLLGTSLTWDGATFDLGAANVANDVSAAGQTIILPAGNFSTLRMVATGVNGSQTSQNFVVTYTDNSTTTFTQSLSDWYTPQNYSGESPALSMAYRNTSSGAKDNRTFYLYGYAFALNNAKTVSSIQLPENSNVEVFGLSLVP